MNSLYGIPKTFQFVNLKLSIPYVTFFMPYRLNYIFFVNKDKFSTQSTILGTTPVHWNINKIFQDCCVRADKVSKYI